MTFKKIAVAFDESAEADRAFHAALDLAKLTSAELYIVTVIENLPAYISYVSAVAPDVPGLLKSQRRTFYEDLHGRAKLIAEQSGIRFHAEIAEGDEIQAMLQLLEQIRPDLLVVGLRLEPGGLSQLLGGTAHRLALRARCNVLGIR
jgi:nucleotide-binding universal stress UspA family protein